MALGAPEDYRPPRESRHLFRRNWKRNWCHSKKNYCKTFIRAQKNAASINLLEYLEKSAKHEPECLLNHHGSLAVNLASYILFVILQAVN